MKKLIALWALLRIGDVLTTIYALDNQGYIYFYAAQFLSIIIFYLIFNNKHNKNNSFARKILIIANMLATIVVINNLFTIGLL